MKTVIDLRTNTSSHLFVGPMNLASVRKDYSLHWHFRNCNHTSEIPKISTRHPQTPNEAIGTLCAMFAIQEVLKKVRMARCTGSLSCLFSCTNYNGAKHVCNKRYWTKYFLTRWGHTKDNCNNDYDWGLWPLRVAIWTVMTSVIKK